MLAIKRPTAAAGEHGVNGELDIGNGSSGVLLEKVDNILTGNRFLLNLRIESCKAGWGQPPILPHSPVTTTLMEELHTIRNVSTGIPLTALPVAATVSAPLHSPHRRYNHRPTYR